MKFLSAIGLSCLIILVAVLLPGRMAVAGDMLTIAPTPLTYVYPDQSVWTTRTDKDGKPANPLLRLAAVMFARAGIAWQGSDYPASRMFSILRGNDMAFSMLVRAPSLKECCLISAKPVASTELRVYHRPDRPAVRQRDGLVGKRVIIILGYSYADLRDFIQDPANRIQVEVAATHRAAFAMLDRNRGDYLLDYAGPAAEILTAHPMADLQHDTLSRLDVHMVLNKKYPQAEQVMSRLEAIVETLDVPTILGTGHIASN